MDMSETLAVAVDLLVEQFGNQPGPEALEQLLLSYFPELADDWQRFRRETIKAARLARFSWGDVTFAKSTRAR